MGRRRADSLEDKRIIFYTTNMTEGPPHPLHRLAIEATSVVSLAASDALDALVDALIEWRVIEDDSRQRRFSAPKAYRRWTLLREWAWTWAWDEVGPRFFDETPIAGLDTWVSTSNSPGAFFGVDRAMEPMRLAGVQVEDFCNTINSIIELPSPERLAQLEQVTALLASDVITRDQAMELLRSEPAPVAVPGALAEMWSQEMGATARRFASDLRNYSTVTLQRTPRRRWWVARK